MVHIITERTVGGVLEKNRDEHSCRDHISEAVCPLVLNSFACVAAPCTLHKTHSFVY